MFPSEALSRTSTCTIRPESHEPDIDNVILHKLCDNCSGFCQQWEVLNWIQQPVSKRSSTWPKSRLCTVAHLVANHDTCHFCKFLLGCLHRSHKASTCREDELGIYLRLQEDKDSIHRGYNVRAEVAEEVPTGNSANFFFATVLLKKYQHSDDDAFQQHVTAKSVPRFAHNNLKRARSWIETCKSSHESCRQFHLNTVRHDRQRPTRVLEINGSLVRLRCNMTNEPVDYLVVSHMWGKPSSEHDGPLQLTLSNLRELRGAVPWCKLSPIYREAIRVTNVLGYRYLWIDSLCIIQDSAEDWKHEARLMARVYGNASCNLTFLFPDSIEPTSHTRPNPRTWNPCILRPSTLNHPGIAAHHHTADLRTTYQSHEPQDWLIQSGWPLFRRAWTFQEYLLSPRTLLLGHRNLMWQCSHGFYDELMGPIAEAERSWSDEIPKKGRDMGKSRYFPASLSTGLGECKDMSDPKVLSFMKDWQALVNEYRSRQLTKAVDRVIAFAGIARAFTNLGSLTYLAGCWAELYPLSLLWYVDKKINETVRRENPGIRRGETIDFEVKIHEDVTQEAPSFSQFSVPIYTHHQTYFLFNDDEVYVKGKSYAEKPRVYWHDIYWTKLHTFQFGKHPTDKFLESGYYDFAGLQVTLEMPILPVSVSWPVELGKQFSRIRSSSKLDASLCWEPVFTYYPDTSMSSEKSKESFPPKHGVLAMIAEFQICRLGGKYGVQRRFAGLVLVRGAQIGSWQRVGVWKLRIKISAVHVDEESLGDVAQRWKSYEIAGDVWTMERITLA